LARGDAALNIDESHLLRARLSRVEEYADVARLYKCYQTIVLSPSLDALIPWGQRVLLAPDRLDDQREAWLRFGVALYRRHQVREAA